MKKGLFGAIAIILIAMASPASAWSDADCRRACRETASVSVEACMGPTGHNCAQYKGQKSAGAAAVNSFSRSYNAQHGTPAQRQLRRGQAGAR